MFLFRLPVVAIFLITTLFATVPVVPVSAQTGQTTTDTTGLLQNADRFFAEKSYALAAESYGKYLLAVPLDGEVRYRYAVSLIRSQSWNQALTTTNAQKPLGHFMRFLQTLWRCIRQRYGQSQTVQLLRCLRNYAV